MNQVIIIGNLTKDPELRYTNSQKAVCKFTVAVNERVKNPNTGEYEDKPSFIPVIVWDRQAENCDKFLSKGRKVAVSGRIKTGSYTKQDGTKVYTTDVVANNVEFLGGQEEVKESDPYMTRQQYEQSKAPQGFAAVPDDEFIGW